MSVRKRNIKEPKTGQIREYWMIDVDFELPDGTRKRIRKTSPVQTKRGAEQYERELRNSLLAGTYRKEEKQAPIFEEFAKEFLETYAVTNNKPSEVRSKRKILRVHLVPEFGKKRLNEITKRDIENFKSQKLKAGLAPKTINNLLTTFRRLLAVAQEWEIIETIPAVQWLKVPEPQFDFLSFEEAELLIGAADQWKSMIVVALKTGLRQSELLGLRWEDVEFSLGKLFVRQAIVEGNLGTPKNGKSRELPLCDSALDALKACRHLRGKLVFCDENGNPLTMGQCKRPLWNACKKAGIRRIGWHVLRHTFASHLAMKGVSLKVIQELLGHSTITMTMRYSHLSPCAKRDAVQLLDGTIAAQEVDSVAN